ncbi:MAG: TetR/AcrR family transcriptional regulator [Rikenellaceae bacterium]
MTRREKYLERIYTLFSTESIEGLTMSDIADRIHITKMTLYNNFKDKNEIIESVINYRSRKYIEYFEKVDCHNKNAIEVLIAVLEFQRKNPLMVSHLYISLLNNYPEQFKEHEERFRNGLRSFIRQNILQGQKEAIFRADVDAEEISSYLIMTMDNMLSSAVKSGVKIDLNEVHKNLIKYHIRGIANEKGLKILQDKTK